MGPEDNDDGTANLDKRINRSFDIRSGQKMSKIKASNKKTSKKIFRNFGEIVDDKNVRGQQHSILVSAKHSSKNDDTMRQIMNRSAHGFADLSGQIGEGLNAAATMTEDARHGDNNVQTSVIVTARDGDSEE